MVALPEDCLSWLSSRGQIDEAGGALRSDPSDSQALRRVQCFRLFRLSGLDAVLSSILTNVAKDHVIVAARLKRLSTIIRKLTRYSDMSLTRMQDIVGARVVCDSVTVATKIKSALSKLPYYNSVKNYVAEPQATGYRAFHLMFRVPSALPNQAKELKFDIEIQIRTFYQQLWSLVSESYGEQVKEGGGDPEVRAYLSKLSSVIREREEAFPDEQQTNQFPLRSTREIVVARVGRDVDRPTLMLFDLNYSAAISQVIAWEEDPSGGFSDTLLLIGATGVQSLSYTHSVFLGMQKVPLPDWMPELRQEG